jgi:protein-L-isoaspartate O-methyltransferase
MSVANRAQRAIRIRRERAGEQLRALRARVMARSEKERATEYWRSLPDYHAPNDDPIALERSQWIADVLVPELGIGSLLEVGTNNGRNLAVVKTRNPDVRVGGIDVNEHALESARARGLDIELRLQDANEWTDAPGSWDGILTMSVLDHVPDEAVEMLASNFAKTARYVIAVELWTGREAETARYKYSRDTRALFERHGAKTLRWELAPGQYDVDHSPLWVYVGAFDSEGLRPGMSTGTQS